MALASTESIRLTNRRRRIIPATLSVNDDNAASGSDDEPSAASGSDDVNADAAVPKPTLLGGGPTPARLACGWVVEALVWRPCWGHAT